MKKIILAIIVFGVAYGFVGCKYDDSYLDAKLPKTIAYFASFQEYTRTVIVGEGLNFKIGGSMAGLLSNKTDQTIDFKIFNYTKKSPFDVRQMLPTALFKINGSAYTTGTEIHATIPAGKFIGYFDVKLDSAAFLANPLSYGIRNNPADLFTTPVLTVPVRIIRTSLDSIGQGLDSIFISVKYQASVDGYYLYETTVKKEFPAGTMLNAKTQTDNYLNETDNSTYRLFTVAPFKVEVTTPNASIIKGLKFNLTVASDKTVTYDAVAVPGQPKVTPESTNTYDSKTRDFALNFNYKKGTPNDTIFHVTTKMIFRSRIIDNIVQTRDYLSYLNK
jgi:hypothetical protein